MRHDARVLLAAGCRLLLAAVFLWAAVAHLIQGAGFTQTIVHYRLLRGAAAPALSLLLPCVELVVGVGLLSARLRRGALVLALALLGIFALALLQATLRGIDLACGCFGGGPEGPLLGLVRDAVLLAAALIAWRAARAPQDPVSDTRTRRASLLATSTWSWPAITAPGHSPLSSRLASSDPVRNAP